MLPTVNAILGVPLVKGAQFGVEIELEGRDVPRITPELASLGWVAKQDLSLKAGGVEYVFRKPLSLERTNTAIKALYKEINNLAPMYTNRTATHVHYNISDLPLDRMYDLFVLNLMFEELLLSYVEEERRGNMFCLSASDAEAVIIQLMKDKQHGTLQVVTGFERYKYGNLNFAAAGRYGTLEYRSLQTPKDADVLLNWVKVINQLNDHIRLRSTTAAEFIREASLNGPVKWAHMVLGSNMKMFNPDMVESLMLKGIRNAQHVAFTDLNIPVVSKIKPKPLRPVAPPIPNWMQEVQPVLEIEQPNEEN